jgi:ribosomal-protein-alanine N-acetyltransferase
MPTRSTAPSLETRGRGLRVYLRTARNSDTQAFLAAVAASRRLHRGWVEPPSTRARFATYVTRFAAPSSRSLALSTSCGFLVCRVDDDALVGVFNFSEVVRGSFESAYLGYYAFAPHHGEGYMGEGIRLALDAAFRTLKLHRVEASIQPTNTPSIELVRRAGFTREGYSRRYVKIAGRWRDHERWAMLIEDWRSLRPRRK